MVTPAPVVRAIGWAPTRAVVLTDEQTILLQLLARGMTYQQIARLMHLKHHTVRSRFGRIRRVLGALNTHHLIARAYRLGVLPCECWTEMSGRPLPADEEEAQDWPAESACEGSGNPGRQNSTDLP